MEEPNELYALFDQASELSPNEREAFLVKHCAARPELAARLRLMLHEGATGGLGELEVLAAGSAEVLGNEPTDSAPSLDRDRKVGRYRIERTLGSGGFGVVYLAEQIEPVRRLVALKVLHPERNSLQIRRRFAAERQTLARMDHPNIAKVYDAGVTDEGLPYFAMQYVDGVPLTQYSDQRRLTIEERLELFAVVCEAVAHAHVKSVVHRDLKPSNVLVASNEAGGPQPMVIDFGVAKVLQGGDRELTDRHTNAGVVLGTLAYMSPEQAQGLTDVDTKSDVYSLGVMLYELLCGAQPFTAEDFLAAARAKIVVDDPPTPSQRLRASDAAKTVAESRKTTIPELSRRLRRELEWIPLRAMRKSPSERYEGVAQLRDDIRNYLAGRPLISGPESTPYRLAKFIRRNRVMVSAGTLAAGALSVGLVASLHSLRIADGERAKANQRADELDRLSTFQARMLSGFSSTSAASWLEQILRSQLASAGLGETSRANELMVQLDLGSAATGLVDKMMVQPAVAAVDDEFRAIPRVDAALCLTLGEATNALGNPTIATQLLERSESTHRQEWGACDARTVRASIALVDALLASGELARGESVAAQALASVAAEVPESDPRVAELTAAHGRALLAVGRIAPALEALRRAETRLSAFVEQDRTHRASLRRVRLAWAKACQLNESPDEAERILRALIEEIDASTEPDADLRREADGELGGLLVESGKPLLADAPVREQFAWNVLHRGRGHPSTLLAQTRLGSMLAARGQFALADQNFRQVLDAMSLRGERDHPEALAAMDALGNAWIVEGRHAEAVDVLSDVYQRRVNLLGEGHVLSLRTAQALCVAYVQSNQTAPCRKLLDKIDPHIRDQFAPGQRIVVVNKLLRGMALMYDGETSEGAAIISSSTAEFSEDSRPSAQWKALAFEMLAAADSMAGDHQSMIRSYREAARLYSAIFGDSSPPFIRCTLRATNGALGLQRYAEAEQGAKQLVKGMRSLGDRRSDEYRQSLAALVTSTMLQGRTPEARNDAEEWLSLERARGAADPRNLKTAIGARVFTMVNGGDDQLVVDLLEELRSMKAWPAPGTKDAAKYHYLAGNAYLRLGRPDRALVELKAASEALKAAKAPSGELRVIDAMIDTAESRLKK